MSANDVIKSLEALAPAIKARRAEIEQARRLPMDLVGDLRKTGVFSLTVPSDLGGRQSEPLDTLRAIETVAAADGSTGWCVMIGASGNGAAGLMNQVGAKEIVDPNAPVAAIAGPIGAAIRVDGGFRVSGRWPFGSGITHSPWVWAGCMVMENGQPKMTERGPATVHAWIPTSEIEIHDTWFTSGMAGTGSNDFSASDVFVPDTRIFHLFDTTTHRPDPLYQMPPVTQFVSQVASVSLGIARAALDELTEMAATKAPTLSMVPLADKALAQIELARLETAWGSARAFLHSVIDEMWRTVNAGGTPTMRVRALSRTAASNAVETSARIAAQANTLAGGSALYSSSSMQRHMRDAEVITHHFTVAPHVWEEAGRVLMGREPTVPLF